MRTTLYKPGDVYLVNFHIAYKLGVSTAFHYRMTEYRMFWRTALEQSGYPAPELVHMFSVENMRETEKAIQHRWRDYRSDMFIGQHEFFVLPPDEVDWFCSHRPTKAR